jgi:transcriptional regulator with XRE-family HTH domain
MSISASRASRLEQAEVDDSLRLSTLRRAAAALNCRLLYVLVPDEPLEDMVLRQAYRRAEEEVKLSMSDPTTASPAPAGEIEDWLESRTLDLVDHRGLWRQISALDYPRPWTRDDLSIEGAFPWLGRGRRGQGRPEADGVQP